MKCENWREKIISRIYGDSFSGEHQLMDLHLNSCVSCSGFYNSLANIKKNIVPSSVPQNDQFWLRQKSRIVDRLSKGHSRPVPRWILVPVFGILAMIAFWLGQARTVENMRMVGDMEFIQNLEVVQNLELLENMDDLDQI